MVPHLREYTHRCHILCKLSSPQPVCSTTSTYQHGSGFSRASICLLTKSRASWQQLVIEPSPTPKNFNPIVIFFAHGALRSKHGAVLPWEEKSKAAVLVYGLWPSKADSPNMYGSTMNIRALTRNRMGKCLLPAESAWWLLHLTTDKESWLYPVHLGEELKRIRCTAWISGLNSAPLHSKWCF